ncbi:MAG: hypothetical protein K1X66_08730 [Verrucomicrobiae bacterium]|nr:hypothetical protein [Verrucomicrobiae bacterium]
MKSRLLLSLLLLCGCASNGGGRHGSDSSIAWDLRKPTRYAPNGQVFLNVNGESYQIISRATARYRQLAPQEFQSFDIPSDAITAVSSWYANGGDILFVVEKSHQLEVFRREKNNRPSNYYVLEKVSTIPL